jgi:hypothetical protein
VQDLDLQETNKKITQYQSYSKECPQCGYENHDNSYPNFVAPHVSYGKNIMAIVVYLNVVHYVSYKRIVQTLKTMYKLDISEGAKIGHTWTPITVLLGHQKRKHLDSENGFTWTLLA